METPIISFPIIVVPAFSTTNRAHIAVRVHKESNTVLFYVDGQRLQVWKDPNGFVGQGTGIRFVHNGPGLIKISDIRVSPWDGVQVESAAAAGQDSLELTNGATLSGAVETVSADTLTLRGAKEKTEIPRDRIRRVIFGPPPPAENIEPPAGWVRATLANGGNLVFQIQSWDSAGVKIRSPFFGDARFDPAVFQRLRFFPLPTNSATAPESSVIQ
jgi:hypothetical protein